ncbi:DeoR family transcriptional regulator [Rhizosaccharibacter radicis]|uniref:DeoR family transcriptional regulator n=1 Tax=Rhizosaccharibacter radicis TaxID=2782605 RepID=A0ABT1VXY2_9PROT|nr:DeoR family transcriptional regulator [Acetobacteraceae bacterium KSS12]
MQRRLEIAERIRREGRLRVDALSRDMQVSAVTIRGDLAYLEEQGLIVRAAGEARIVRGSAWGAEDRGRAPPTQHAVRPLLLDAARIAAGRGSILLGPGRLPGLLLPHLPPDPHRSVILCSLDPLPVALGCLDGPVHLTGGRVGRDNATLEGPQVAQAFELHRPDLCVLEGEQLLEDRVCLPPGTSEVLHRQAVLHSRAVLVMVPPPRGGTSATAGPAIRLDQIDHLLLAGVVPGQERFLARGLLEEGFRQVTGSAGCVFRRDGQGSSAMSDQNPSVQ